MQRRIRALAGLVLLLSLGSACDSEPPRDERATRRHRDRMGMMERRGMMDMSRVRHRYVMRNGVDSPYASRKNPFAPSPEKLREGRRLYEDHCARCHGAAGTGDGPAGEGLEPPPANIAAFSDMPMATDGYLYWTIAEGGAPVGSAMPPFKGVLDEEQIWRIILHLRQM